MRDVTEQYQGVLWEIEASCGASRPKNPLPPAARPASLAPMSIAELPIVIDREKIAAFCRERGIRKLSLFGSVLRDDFDPARSDVDVLAEFDPHALEGVGFRYFAYGEELGAILGHTKTDFCTQLRPWLQPLVEKRALVIYDVQTS